MAFSPDGARLLTGAWDWTSMVWDLNGQRQKVLRGHDHHVLAVAWSAGQARRQEIIATASRDGTARTWEPETGDALHRYVVYDEMIALYAIKISPDATNFAVAADKGVATIFSLRPDRVTKGDAVAELKPARKKDKGKKEDFSKMLDLAYSADGRSIATAHDKGGVRIWDLALRVPVQLLIGHGHRVSARTRWKVALVGVLQQVHLARTGSKLQRSSSSSSILRSRSSSSFQRMGSGVGLASLTTAAVAMNDADDVRPPSHTQHPTR